MQCTECLDELFFNTPFAATVGYSMAAAFGLSFVSKNPANSGEDRSNVAGASDSNFLNLSHAIGANDRAVRR